MRFEARELKPYGEPVAAQELRVGRVYFSVQYVDEEMLIPTLEPLEFQGANIRAGDVGQLYFRAVGPLVSSIVEVHGAGENLRRTTEDQIKDIFEYERALDLLLACALRRKERRDSD